MGASTSLAALADARAAAAVVMVLGVFGWAWLSTDRSTIARAVLWMEADVGDQHRFPARPIRAGEAARSLPAGSEAELVAPDLDADGRTADLDDLLRETDTLAFVVAHEDRLVYERYFGGSDRGTLQTSFSVAKSFVSTLVGIAIEEGLVGGVDDPVTDYLPELAARDARFKRITLRHLLTMASGIRYSEPDLPWPWSDDTDTYYGVDLREVALERSQVEQPPGQEWHYNNYHPLLLGLVLERATGTSVSNYMATRLWQALGAGSDASWNLDSERSGFEKLESGLNATAVDYARFGLLFLHGGRWKGKRVVSEEWVRAATAAQTTTDYDNAYGYFWWVDAKRPGNFYAFGNYGQYIYVAPGANVVIVRSGRDRGVDNHTWLDIFRAVTDQLADTPRSRTGGRPSRPLEREGRSLADSAST
jgi:CubicO group peptidase (beta-lactamase class C family)